MTRHALAQIGCDPEHTLGEHLEMLAKAAALGCQFVFFPELSLTGYHPTKTTATPLDLQDPHLEQLASACQTHDITALVGAPLSGEDGVLIGVVEISPGGEISNPYSKRHLHEDERPFFIEGSQLPLLRCGGERIGLAVCYELSVPEHLATVASLAPSILLVSVAKDTQGMQRASETLARFARARRLLIALVNATGVCEGFMACGGTRCIGADGEIIAALDGQKGMLVFDTATGAATPID